MPADPQFSGRPPLHQRKLEELRRRAGSPRTVRSGTATPAPAPREAATPVGINDAGQIETGEVLTPSLPAAPPTVRFPKFAIFRGLLSLWRSFSKHKDQPNQPIMDIKLKPGVKTSELWVIVGTGIIGTALAVLDKCQGEHVVIVGGVLTAIYTLVRGAIKKAS